MESETVKNCQSEFAFDKDKFPLRDYHFVVELCHNCDDHGGIPKHDESRYQNFFN